MGDEFRWHRQLEILCARGGEYYLKLFMYLNAKSHPIE